VTETPLDIALASGDRMRFFSAFAGAELFLLLAGEADGDTIEPEVFETDEGTFVLVFDREDRLARFVGGLAPYAGLTGRALTEMLSGQGIGVALNPDVAPISELLAPDAIAWLMASLGPQPQEVGARPRDIGPPQAPEALIVALDGKLAGAVGLARFAYLVHATYGPERQGHILAFVDAYPGSEAALAQLANEALVFSSQVDEVLDVAFFDASDPMSARLAAQGLRFDLPQLDAVEPLPGPGLSADAPPRLR